MADDLDRRARKLIARLEEPDFHDPACPFSNHCYCDDADHDRVTHPDALPAAKIIDALLTERPALITRLRASEAATAAAVERAERAEKQCAWMDAAAKALSGYERDCGGSFDDMHELGRIEESNDSPSFRIRVGHIRSALPSTPPVAEEAHD